MTIHLASIVHGNLYTREHIFVEQEYEFMGHIVDMSNRRDEIPEIPEKPFVYTEMLKRGTYVEMWLKDEKVIEEADQNLFVCKAKEFNSLPGDLKASKKNLAIANFLKALDPKTLIVIELS